MKKLLILGSLLPCIFLSSVSIAAHSTGGQNATRSYNASSAYQKTGKAGNSSFPALLLNQTLLWNATNSSGHGNSTFVQPRSGNHTVKFPAAAHKLSKGHSPVTFTAARQKTASQTEPARPPRPSDPKKAPQTKPPFPHGPRLSPPTRPVSKAGRMPSPGQRSQGGPQHSSSKAATKSAIKRSAETELTSDNVHELYKSPSGQFFMTHDIDVSNSPLPDNLTARTPFNGSLECNDYAIRGLRQALFSFIDNAFIHVVLESPAVNSLGPGHTACVANHAGNGNVVNASVVNGHVGCNATNSTTPCYSALLVARVSGNNNQFSQYATNGTVTIVAGLDTSFAAGGIAHNLGANNTLQQIDSQVNIIGIIPDNTDTTGVGSGSLLAAATAIGRENGTGTNLELFSGGNPTLPAVARAEAPCGSESILDRLGYGVAEPGCDITELFTDDPRQWQQAQQVLCNDTDCDGSSCHYVHEQFQTLLQAEDYSLHLVSRQSWPFYYNSTDPGLEPDGIFRITHLTQAFNSPNPQYNGEHLYRHPSGLPSVSMQQVPVAQLLHKSEDDAPHLTLMYALEPGYTLEDESVFTNGGFQLASFNLNAQENTSYWSQQYELQRADEKPALISGSGRVIWTIQNNVVYEYFAEPYQLNPGSTYDLSGSTYAARKIIALGIHSSWLYIARANPNDNAIVERFSLASRELDQGWVQELKQTDAACTKGCTLVIRHDANNEPMLALQPVGSVVVPERRTVSGISSSIAVKIPELGRCTNWQTVSFLVTEPPLRGTSPPTSSPNYGAIGGITAGIVVPTILVLTTCATYGSYKLYKKYKDPSRRRQRNEALMLQHGGDLQLYPVNPDSSDTSFPSDPT